MANINVITAVAGENQLTAEDKVTYYRNTLEAMKPELIHDQFGKKANLPKNGGRTLNFRRLESVATNYIAFL